MKNAGLLLLFGLIAALFGGWFLWQSGRLPVTPSTPLPVIAETPAPFTELASGTDASVTTRENYLISTDEELRSLWPLLNPRSGRPVIDFTKEVVIAVFAGEEPTAGYAIAVSAITDTTERMVTIQISAPGVTCLAAQVVTTPYQVLKIPKTDLALTHEDTVVTTGCLD